MVRMNGVLRAEKHRQVHIHQGGPRCILQQDNDPKLTAKNHLQCRKVLEMMARPPQSPLLNSIECVRDTVKDLGKPETGRKTFLWLME